MRDAIRILCEYEGVANAGGRRRAAGDGRRVAGVSGTRAALGRSRAAPNLADAVSAHMSPPLRMIGAGGWSVRPARRRVIGMR